MSNSSLVNYTRISPNSTNPRKDTIKKITIHHVAGNCSVETIGNIFAPETRNASANYGIGSDGRVGMYVEEKNRSWCSSNADNDNQAITIEVANDGGAPDWHVSDKAFAKLIDLCVDICKRNNIKKLTWTGDKNGTLTCHYMFAATACPGAYLKSKMPYIASEVNKKLSPKYIGYLDVASSTSATGWAWNSIDDTALKVDIKIYKGNSVVKVFTTNANVYRADLKKANIGNGTHGFNIKLDFNGLGYGTFTVKAFANGVQLNNAKTIKIEAPKTTSSYINNGLNYALVFEPTYYSNKYSDLKKAFGTDTNKLFAHFINYGMKEGRQAISTFNVITYKNRYADLQKAFGNNLTSYYKHYIQYGYKEKRTAI